ncbi:MAG: DUF3140 domain-containing protein [Sphingomicrobium sp.]|nr:DUF3140 domain-containing protein [Sphingomonadales bacterium]
MAQRGTDADVRKRFRSLVNMSAGELEAWLATRESLAVGWKGKDGKASESVGHASGRRIVAILRKRTGELTPGDYSHMRKVVGFIRRHGAQRPPLVAGTRWAASMMNWGHDPQQD